MHLDGRSLPPNTKLSEDVCIVGAGAAGITLARELGRRGIGVVLLESGGFELESPTQELYDGSGESEILPSPSAYLKSSRLRFFGGTTNHWNGWCRPLDPIDFEERPWVEWSGWPFGRAELDPYYLHAAEILQIPPFGTAATPSSPPSRHALFPVGAPIETTMVHDSPPTRFGQVYRSELVHSSAVQLVTHANVQSLETDGDGTRIRTARVSTLEGNRFEVGARVFVLAAGGIENPRLLLLSDSVHAAGLGNQNDLVGRFFMDHPVFNNGWVVLPGRPKKLDLYHGTVRQTRGFLRVSDPVQRAQRLLNSAIVFVPLHVEPDLEVPLRSQIERLASELLQPPSTSTGARPARVHTSVVRVVLEQAPNSESRVRLGEERDVLGQRRLRLDWRMSALDATNHVESLELLGRELGARGLGRSGYVHDASRPWMLAGWSSHHIGTTRMHDDPKRGVVDGKARVHGLANLWIAGSSLFPTSGCSTPTLTIVALSLRLADRLREVLPTLA